MYSSVQGDGDDRFPTQTFDPKAVTRSSYEKKAPKPKPKGPLIAVNRHPEYVFCIPDWRELRLHPRHHSSGLGVNS
jgi:hypothetical protein